MPDWTKEQREAIEARGTNLLVSAAAGSGKTAVMIERIFRLIAGGAGIDRMMVVTFTNMAAASMRDKLAERLDEALAEDPANEHLLRQRSLLDRANISTIHSFCLQLLKRYYFKTPLPPDFHLVDSTQETMIEDAAMKQILEEASERYENGDFPAYGQVLTQFTAKNTDRDLEDTLRFLSKTVRSMTDPDEFFEKTLAYFADETGSKWKEALMTAFSERLREAIDYLSEIERVFTNVESKTGEFVTYYADPFALALEETTPEGMLEKLSFSTKRNNSKNPAFKKSIKAVADFRNDLVKRLTPMITYRPIDVQEAVKALFELLKAYETRKNELMLAESGVTFDGLLHGTLDLFRDHPDIKEDIRQSIDYIFVDEYQDVNILQNTIVESLSKGDNLFFVGDIKQCIYGFQLARPDLFSEKLHQYDKGVIGRRINLKNNFRSNAAILDAVNALFRPLMTARTAILPYDDEAKLMPAPSPDAPQVQPGFFSEAGPETPCEMMLTLEKDNEAPMLGQRILELTKCKYIGKDGERPVLYRDIAVLTRDNKYAADLAAALNAMGIPAVASVEQETDQSDVYDVLALLRVLLLRRSDLDLITVMLREFSATELVNIRVFTEDRSCPFYDACLLYDGDQSLKDKIAALFARLDKLNLLEKAMSLPNFLEYLLENEGYRYTAVFRNGQAGEKSLNELVFAARTYSEFGKGGLRGFLAYYDHYRTDTRSAMAVNESDNAVRLMTIHKSKGLEFPVVILAGTQNSSNGRKSKLVFDEMLGLGFCPAEEDELGVRTIAKYALSKDAITENQKREERMEELRLLYVALTRAQNKLIISMALSKKLESFTEQFCLPGDLVTANADNYASLLLPLFYYHRDGQALRDLHDDPFTEPLFFEGTWNVRVYPEGSFAALENTAAAQPENEADDAPEVFDEDEYLAKARASFAWKYPYEPAVRARTKHNPSKKETRQRIELRPPSFMDREYTGAQKGTVVHLFMEHADFASNDDARTQAERMKAAGILSSEEFDALPFRKLDEFFACPLGQRLKKSGQINRERSFCLIVPFAETGDEALVQGIIDCYFFEGDSIVLLDYKTDVIHDNLAERVKHHSPQLKIYQAALEQMYPGKTVTPYLYFFSVGKTKLVR